jgi:hypothetical protein
MCIIKVTSYSSSCIYIMMNAIFKCVPRQAQIVFITSLLLVFSIHLCYHLFHLLLFYHIKIDHISGPWFLGFFSVFLLKPIFVFLSFLFEKQYVIDFRAYLNIFALFFKSSQKPICKLDVCNTTIPLRIFPDFTISFTDCRL